jgi:hypothetical protein
LLLEGWFCEGDFFRPRMLAALEIGANEDVSLEVWRGHSWVDGCACLLMLPSSCFWFSCTQSISLSLSLSLFKLYHPRLVSICCLKNVLALWDSLDVTFLFRLPKSISSAFVSAPYENQFLVWMVMLVDCMSLFMAGYR